MGGLLRMNRHIERDCQPIPRIVTNNPGNQTSPALQNGWLRLFPFEIQDRMLGAFMAGARREAALACRVVPGSPADLRVRARGSLPEG